MMKLLAVMCALAGSASAISLTGATFDEGIAGKAAFIKFQAPW
jgi:hypothetical protein